MKWDNISAETISAGQMILIRFYDSNYSTGNPTAIGYIYNTSSSAYNIWTNLEVVDHDTTDSVICSLITVENSGVTLQDQKDQTIAFDPTDTDELYYVLL